jgi:hypothetical protein
MGDTIPGVTIENGPQAAPRSRLQPALSRRAKALRWMLLIAGIVLLNLLAARGLTAMVETRLSDGLSGTAWVGIAALAVYVLLLALPFVPGVEIGISLLIMQGSAIAPFVFVATVAGLSLAYGAGRALATRLPCGFLRVMGLPRACAFVDAMKGLDRGDRLAVLEQAAPVWMGTWIIRYRYILLAILINLPGNSLIGGGGGILVVAGLSRLFAFPALLLTLAIATAPVPLAVYMFGIGFLN